MGLVIEGLLCYNAGQMSLPEGCRLLSELNYQHFELMAQLEETYYSRDYITPAEESYRWYRRHPYSTLVVADGDEIAGFVNLFPVKAEVFAALLAGQLNDHDMGAEAMLNPAEHAEEGLEMFLSCVVVSPRHRGGRLVPAMLKEAIKPYLPYLPCCRRVITDNVTDDGERFSRRYGFRPLGHSGHASKLYMQDFADFIRRIEAATLPDSAG